MSRIGKRPIEVPTGVTVTVDPGRVTVNGRKGELRQVVPLRIKIEQEDGTIVVTRPTERGEDRALHGLTRTLVANMVDGVTNGFEKKLELQGVGYRASLHGTDLELLVGYSHPVRIKPRQGIEFEVPVPTQIVVRGIDKQLVGQTAAEIRKVRPPEPYKGKGIRYEGEHVRRKVGKRAWRPLRPPGARAPPSPRARQGQRHRRPAAPGRVPLEPRRLRAARRRPDRQDARGRRLGRICRSRSRATRARRPRRSASCLPPRRRRPASRPSCSIAAATCTTDASRRSPTARARED